MEASGSDSDSSATASTMASILGIKGPIRVRPHGSSQKAHVVLRRVELADDSSDDGETRTTVYFSLFSYKKIDVKPGKELLLALPGGKHKDQAIIFEADLPGEETGTDIRVDTETESGETGPVLQMGDLLPPKMRRDWSKKFSNDVNVTDCESPFDIPASWIDHAHFQNGTELVVPHPRRVEHASVAVQAEPTFTTASVQTNPTPQKDSDMPIIPIIHEHRSSDVERVEAAGAGIGKKETHFRSLSPMELDSSSSTPPISPRPTLSQPPLSIPPAHKPHQPPSHDECHLISRPPLFSINSQNDASPFLSDPPPGGLGRASRAKNPQRPPTPEAHSTNSDSGKSPLFVEIQPRSSSSHLLPLSSSPQSKVTEAGEKTTPLSDPASKITMTKRNKETSRLTPLAKTSQNLPSQKLALSPLATEVHSSASSASSMVESPISPIVDNALTSVKQNLTDLVTDPAPMSRAQSLSPMDVSPASTSSSTCTPVLPSTSVNVLSPSGMLSAPQKAIPLHTGPGLHKLGSNGIPSVGRPSSEDVKPCRPRNPALVSKEILPSSVINTPRTLPYFGLHPLPAKPLDTLRSASSSRITLEATRIALPPDPKSLAYISTPGSLSNPLGIRPSSTLGQRPQPSASSSSTTTQTKPKKALSIGSGWLHARNNGSFSQTSQQTDDTDFMDSIAREAIEYIMNIPLSELQSNSSDGSKRKKKKKKGKKKNHSRDHTAGSPVSTPKVKLEPKEANLPLASRAAEQDSAQFMTFGFSAPAPLSSKAVSSPESTSKIAPFSLPKTNGHHPLPVKPVPLYRCSSDESAQSSNSRGVKRGGSPLLDPEGFRPTKRVFKWPTIESTYRMRIEGDVSIKGIMFSSDGSHFVVNCNDKTVRIWNNRNRAEVARLAYNSPVVSVVWMQDDAGIVSLCQDGTVSKWTRTGMSDWNSAKLFDLDREQVEGLCFAYHNDRIAISLPRVGVKIWLWIKGTWQEQRSILRQNVTAIKFVGDGDAMIGGTSDGVLWYCEVPNGILRAYSFLGSRICNIDVNSTSTQALVTQVGGRARLINVRRDSDGKGNVEQIYCMKDEAVVPKMSYEFGAVFINQGQTVLFGSVDGCVFVWDKYKGDVVCVLDHCEDDVIQSIAILDRKSALITGTKQGFLNWWSQPSPPGSKMASKRIKTEPWFDY